MRHPIIRRVVGSSGLAMALAAVVGIAPATANGPSISIEPAGPLPAGTTTITITGSGFDPTAARGNGIYVVFGPVTPAPGFYLDAGLYGAFKWVAPGGVDSPATAPLGADGSFSTTLELPSVFTGSSGDVDCSVDACAILTFGAHGSTDRSQDTCTPLTFLPGDTASPAPGASAGPVTSIVPVSPTPDAQTTPDPNAPSEPVGDACSVILGAP
ncbi:MAG: hypothetical protein KF809_00045 [Chloroflexi bacterium]|nr:hypothetical protein [Chloroflexota bacterium]